MLVNIILINLITSFISFLLINRKYIEDVLKTRGLRKSLYFLERLHTCVLRKARLTLEKNDISDILNEEYEGDVELRRYGVWSPEARELNLPSYRYINKFIYIIYIINIYIFYFYILIK